MSEREQIASAVHRIAWGYIFILFNFNININESTIGLVPSWIGYVLIISVLALIASKERSAMLLKPLGIFFIIWTGIDWVLAFIGASIGNSVLSAVVAVVYIYFHFQLITNVAALAKGYGWPGSGRLLGLRAAVVVLQTLSVLMLYGEWIEVGLVVVMSIAQTVLAIWIVAELFHLEKFIQNGYDPEEISEVD